MKKKLDFSGFLDLTENLKLKDRSIDLCINNIKKYKETNKLDSENILKDIDIDDLKKEIKLSIISFKKVYSDNDNFVYEIIITLAYVKDEDLILEYKLIYDLYGKLKSTKLLYELEEFDI